MKVLRLAIVFLFLSVLPLMAQEDQDTEKENSAKAKVKDSEDRDGLSQKTESEKKAVYSLDEVVITEHRFRNIEKINIETAGTTATEITADDIESRSDKVLKDVLYQVPGIQVATERKGTTQFYMRGYDMSKVAILVDGIPLIDSFTGTMDIDNIGLLDISEIIVSRGTTSALYGTKGAVGSINLIRKKPNNIYAKISAEYGQNGNYVTSVSQGAPIGNFYYYISAMHDKSDGYNISKKLDRKQREEWLKKLSRFDLYGFTLDDIYSHEGSSAATYYLNDTGSWDHTSHNKYKFNVKAGYHFTPDLEAGISSFYNNTEKKNSTYFTDMKNMYIFNPATGEKDWRMPLSSYILRNMSSLWPKYNDYAVSPYINYETGRFSLTGNAYLYANSNTFLAYDDPLEISLAFNRDAVTMTWSIWTSKTYGFNIYPSYELSSWNKLNLALSYYMSTHKEEEQAYNDQSTKIIEYYGNSKYETMDIEAGYLTFAVEDEMQIMDDTDLTLGVSYDAQNLGKYQKKSGVTGSTEMVDQALAADDSTIWGTRDSFNPVADLVYEPIEDRIKFKAAVSQKTSFPTLQAYSKTVSYYQESSDPESTNIKLKPEKMFNANLGLELSFFDKQLTWGADYFHSKYQNKITRIYVTKMSDYIYRNIDSAIINGTETTLNLNLPDFFNIADLSLSSTYTYIFSENQANVDDSFTNKGNRFEYLPEHKLTFDIRTHFRTDTDLIIFGNYEYNQIQYTMKEIPQTKDDFSTWYFNAQRLHDPLKIDVKVSQKVLNYYEIYTMCKNILDDYNADPFNPGPGRTWYAGFKASF